MEAWEIADRRIIILQSSGANIRNIFLMEVEMKTLRDFSAEVGCLSVRVLVTILFALVKIALVEF